MMEINGFDWQTWAWALFGFWLGALPFSVWLSRVSTGQDVRQVGDRNPGATNALRLGGWRLGLAVLLLDVTKGALPLGLAYQVFGLRGAGMFLVALAPILGHAFSPFLGGKGGKALAVTLGVWIGLILWEAPLVILPQLTFWYLIQSNSGWAVMLTTAGLGVYLLLVHPQALFLALLLALFALMAWKHREDLRKPLLWRKQLKLRRARRA
jgi:glycerol-3-phosphate acyltransferase PlsY